MTLAYRKEFASEPIAEALRRLGWNTVPLQDPGEMLLEDRADIILGPPLDYAMTLGVVDMALAPYTGVFTAGFAGLIKLIFKDNLPTVSSIAIKDGYLSEVFATQALFAEKHDIEPSLVRCPPHLLSGQMLDRADTALLCGDDAIFNTDGHKVLFDVSDEWEDLGQVPLPYLIGWGRTDRVPQEALGQLQAACEQAMELVPQLAANHPQAAQAATFARAVQAGEITYGLSPEDTDALDTFYRYAFYYCVITDIPSAKFLNGINTP